ncbi:MAG: hypothetical protein LAO21_19820 [Acidobacteriia bacterium]|nr:hypothetical protein [Terriglobia bacterium]
MKRITRLVRMHWIPLGLIIITEPLLVLLTLQYRALRTLEQTLPVDGRHACG